MPECPHGLSDPSWCAVCKGIEDEPTEAGRAFPARYEGKCSCGDKIEIGDMIVAVGGTYVHEECG